MTNIEKLSKALQKAEAACDGSIQSEENYRKAFAAFQSALRNFSD